MSSTLYPLFMRELGPFRSSLLDSYCASRSLRGISYYSDDSLSDYSACSDVLSFLYSLHPTPPPTHPVALLAPKANSSSSSSPEDDTRGPLGRALFNPMTFWSLPASVPSQLITEELTFCRFFGNWSESIGS